MNATNESSVIAINVSARGSRPKMAAVEGLCISSLNKATGPSNIPNLEEIPTGGKGRNVEISLGRPRKNQTLWWLGRMEGGGTKKDGERPHGQGKKKGDAPQQRTSTLGARRDVRKDGFERCRHRLQLQG